MSTVPIILHSKSEILEYLQKNPALYLYSIGDLDDFYWPFTTWYALKENNQITAIALFYTGNVPATLMALSDNNTSEMVRLLSGIKPFLPQKFYAHLTPSLMDVFGRENVDKDFGMNCRMVLKNFQKQSINTQFQYRVLSSKDSKIMEEFYLRNYPENWFEKRMLDTNKFFGCFDNNALVGIAGIHVYSKEYKIAVLGSISTDQKYRNKSICKSLTSMLCEDLLQTVDIIGLNVKKKNIAAMKAYRDIGFEEYMEFEECSF